MQLSEYQEAAARTASGGRWDSYGMSPGEYLLAICCLGLAGEAGEVADLVKKHLGHGHPLDRDQVVKECGDVLWYLAAIASVLGLSLDAIAQGNLAKLRERYPNGFNSEDSLNRRDAA